MVRYYFSLKIGIFLSILRTANAQADKGTKDAVQDFLTALYLLYSYEKMKNNWNDAFFSY
jgi:hypothetical protein